VEKLSDEEIADNIREFDLLSQLHSFFSYWGQEHIDVSSVEQILWISFKCLDLLFSQSLLIAKDILFALELPILSTVESFFRTVDLGLLCLLHWIFLSWKLCWCFFLIDDVISIVIDLLLLLYFMRVIDHHICFQVKLRGVELQIFSLFHTFFKILLEFIFEVSDDRMIEESFPLNSLVGVNG